MIMKLILKEKFMKKILILFNYQVLIFHLKEKNLYSENINLEIKKGNHIGITGTSGSGKTTLVNMIFRILNQNLTDIV